MDIGKKLSLVLRNRICNNQPRLACYSYVTAAEVPNRINKPVKGLEAYIAAGDTEKASVGPVER